VTSQDFINPDGSLCLAFAGRGRELVVWLAPGTDPVEMQRAIGILMPRWPVGPVNGDAIPDIAVTRANETYRIQATSWEGGESLAEDFHNAAIEHRAIIGFLPLATVVDVGANVGQFSLLVRALHPEARIEAFEPLPEAAARFRLVFQGDDLVTLHEATVAPTQGTATMHVSASADSSSLLPISDRQSELFPGTEEVGTADVVAGPLDAYVARDRIAAPAMLKIDMEGFELEVLRGSGSLLAEFQYVYVEASFEALYEGQALISDVAAFLEGRGFVEAGRFNIAHTADGAPIQADFLFQRGGESG
jgi:FkbM family methyltransferase